MRRTRSKSSAFTLLELVVVMIIIAIIAAVIAPSLSAFGVGRSNDDTARQIVSLTQYARTMAASEGRVYRMNFDLSKRSYWLTAQDGGAFGPPTNDFGKRFVAPVGVVKITSDLQPRPDGQYVEFQPGGITDPAPVTLKLTDKFNSTIGITCQSSTELFRIMRKEEMR